MPENIPQPVQVPDTSGKASQKKRARPHFKGHEITTKTIKTPPWTYIHLALISSADAAVSTENQSTLDNLTARTYLTSALTQFLGLSGSAISVDFLKVENSSKKAGRVGEIWVRVPREDAGVFLAAVGGWVGNGVGWKVEGWGNWLGAVIGGSDEDIWGD